MDDEFLIKTHHSNNDCEILDTNQENIKVVFVPECVIQALKESPSGNGGEVPLNICFSPTANGSKRPFWDAKSPETDVDNVIVSSNGNFDIEKFLQSIQTAFFW